jgi:hypothetical protein
VRVRPLRHLSEKPNHPNQKSLNVKNLKKYIQNKRDIVQRLYLQIVLLNKKEKPMDAITMQSDDASKIIQDAEVFDQTGTCIGTRDLSAQNIMQLSDGLATNETLFIVPKNRNPHQRNNIRDIHKNCLFLIQKNKYYFINRVGLNIKIYTLHLIPFIVIKPHEIERLL